MGEKTAITWTRSTFNSWIGCTKVGPGCDHCYAEQQDSRKRWDGGKAHWGAGVPRYRTSASNWKQPLRWNVKQEDLRRQGDAPPWYVFCASLADVFDNEVPYGWRHDLFALIQETPYLSWLLVTKRIGNVERMASAWMEHGFPSNVRLLITVCNQEEADRDIPKLLALPCKNGVSYEPALGAVDWMQFLAHEYDGRPGSRDPCSICGVLTNGKHHPYATGIDWVICGGESGPNARGFDILWARNTIAQCKAAKVPVFVKQLGANVYQGRSADEPNGRTFSFKHRAGADPAEWPKDLRAQEFPA